MWIWIASLLKGRMKWVLGGLAGLLVIGAFVFLIHKLVTTGTEIGQLEASLAAERSARKTLESDAQAKIESLEIEWRREVARAKNLERLYGRIDGVDDEKDGTVAPVLRDTLDRLYGYEDDTSGSD